MTNTTNEPRVRMQLVLDVEYLLNGESPADLANNLESLVQRALGEGLLTGSTNAEVEWHDFKVITLEDELVDRDAVRDFITDAIESGSMRLEDITMRMATYGLMHPHEFSAEMRERMRLDEQEG